MDLAVVPQMPPYLEQLTKTWKAEEPPHEEEEEDDDEEANE